MRCFSGILDDPSALVNTQQPDLAPAIEAGVESHAAQDQSPVPEAESEIVDAEIEGEPEPETVNGDDSPARIWQMIQEGAFDRQVPR